MLGLTGTSREAQVLHGQLLSIFGANLIGLYLGEDIVVDGYGNVTSWPGRIGPALTNTTASYFHVEQNSGRKKLAPGFTTNHLQSDFGGLIPKSIWVLSETPAVPTSIQYGLVHSGPIAYAGSQAALLISSNASNWYTGVGWTHWTDGYATDNIIPGIHLYEAENTSNTDAGIGVGSWSTSAVWPKQIGFVMALDAAATSNQRVAANAVIADYYNLTVTLAVSELSNLFGNSNILKLIDASDAVITGTAATSLVARIGTTVTPGAPDRANYNLVDGKPALVFESQIANVSVYPLGNLGSKTNIVVAKAKDPIPPSNDRMVMWGTENDLRINIPANSNVYETHAGSFYQDGYLGNYAADLNPHVLATTHTVANTFTGVGGGSSSLNNWWGNVWFMMQLSITATQDQIQQANEILKRRFPFLNDQQILTRNLQVILGNSLIGAYFGEDLVTDVDGYVLSWPGRIGPTLTNATANKFLQTTINNKKAFYSTNTNAKALIATDATDCNTAIIIAKAAAVPASSTTYLFTTIGGMIDAIGISSGASSWYVSGAAFKNNGLTTNAIDTNQNIYEASSINTMRGINLCGNGSGGLYGNPWAGSCSCLLKITNTLTDDQRIRMLAVLGNYYGFSAQKILGMQLNVIFGSTLLGAYFGEDLVVDGYNNVTSWPGQIGPTLTNTNSNKFSLGNLFGKKSLTNSVVDTKMLQATLSGIMKEAWSVAKASAIPFTDYRSVVISDDIRQLVGTSSGSTWYGALNSVYRDGYATATVDTFGHIYSGYIVGGATNEIRVGNDPGSGATRTWLGEIALVLALSDQATLDQRLQALALIGSYYGFSTQKIASMKLNAIYGSSLLGAYFGEDLVVDGYNNVTSWPGQVGPTLTNTNSNKFSLGNLFGKKSLTNSVVDTKMLQATLPIPMKEAWAVARASAVPCTDYRAAVMTDAVRQLVGTSGGSTWYGALDSVYRDGYSTANIDTTGHIYSGYIAASASNELRVGNDPGSGATRTWLGEISSVLAINGTATLTQRTQALALLGVYYGFSEQQILTMQLQAIFGTDLLGLYLGEDMIINSTNQLTSWPGRVGATLTYSPNSVGLYYGVKINGRQFAEGINGATDTQKTLLGTMTAAVKSVWAVSKQRINSTGANAQVLISSGAGNTGVLRTGSVNSSWFATGWTLYDRTIANTVVEDGILSIYSGDSSGGASTGIGVMGYWSDTASRSALTDPLGFAMALGAVPTTTQRDLASSLIQSYYTILSEKEKANQIPISNAVAVLPLSYSVKNYGIVGGNLTLVADPPITLDGLSLNGTSQVGYLVSGSSADFSLVFRGKFLGSGGGVTNATLVSAMHNTTGSAWAGWGVEYFNTKFNLIVQGISRVDGTVNGDFNWHTFSLIRNSGTITLYVDGTSVASNATANSVGNSLVIGADFLTSFGHFVPGNVKNLALYHRVLTSQERNSVEAWSGS